MVAFLIPIATGVHALVFGRGLWRKVWYVLPLLGIGLAGWIFSLTVTKAALHEWHWQFVDPSAVYGASAWRKQGEFRDVSVTDLVRLQAVSMSTNFAEVVRNMSYHTDSFSHWCQRSQPGEHRTILNVGLTLLVFIGLGYLLGQFHDRRAFVLFGHSDHFLSSPTCIQSVEPQHWLESALKPHCAFDDPIYPLTIGEAAAERLRKSYVPKRVSYWLTEDPANAPHIALLRALHPDAALQRHPVPRADRTLVAMTVDAEAIAALRTP